MRLYFLFFVVLFSNLYAQGEIKITVQDSLTHEALIGANIFVKNSSSGSTTDLNGISLIKLSAGKNDLLASYVGYKTKEIELQIGKHDSLKNLTVFLAPANIEYRQVTVSTSRVNSFINSSPQRIEILGSEELQEKTIENPANISELLSELSAVNVVQTSTFTGTTNFRLLGLSGQYTQILKDGFPLFGGLSQDFGLIQIPPLNLAQIEIIKGASATFYGNGAIAGIINLISKVPEEKPKTELLVNATTYGAFDAGAFYSSAKNKAAFTMLAMADLKPPVDVNHDGFTEISKLKKFSLEPKLFLKINETNSLKIGASYLHDEHTGGDITAVNSSATALHPFVVKSLSNRLITTIDFAKDLGGNNLFVFRNGISFFDLSNESPAFLFKGNQTSTFSELSYMHNTDLNHFTTGISLLSDNFKRDNNSADYFNDAYQSQYGLFAIDNFKMSSSLSLQAGLRIENSNNFKTYFLPNASLIYKPEDNFFVRFDYGTGYRIPTANSFLSELERNDVGSTKIMSPTNAELSSSLTFDCNYNFMISEQLFVKINQTFFSAEVRNPYLEVSDPNKSENLLFSQTNPLQSYGTETNLRLGFEDASLFVGLTYQKTKRKYSNDSPLPLTPEIKVVSILQLENEKLWELDFGNIYTGSQYLSNGTKVKPYTTFEAFLKIRAGSFDFVANCEDIFDVMQSDYAPLVYAPFTNPKFSEVWAPIEGRTINFSVIYSY